MSDKSPTGLTQADLEQALQDIDSYVDVTVTDLLRIFSLASRHARLRPAENLAVAGLMTRSVHTIPPTASLAEAAHQMLSLRISGLPVVDSGNRLLGLITEADLLRTIGVPGHHPAHSLWQTLETMFARPISADPPSGEVADLMVRDVITVQSEQTVHEVIEVMKQHRIKRVVVVDAQRRITGMLTRSDLIRVFFEHIRNNHVPDAPRDTPIQ